MPSNTKISDLNIQTVPSADDKMVININNVTSSIPFHALKNNQFTTYVQTTAINLSAGLVSFTGSGKYIGGCLAHDGKIYQLPHQATNILVLDTLTNKTSAVNFGLSLTDGSKFIGGVLGRNNTIYCTPFNSSTILMIDTVNLSAVRTNMGLTLTDLYKWSGAVLCPDGKIICIPLDATDFLIIDPQTNTATRSAMGMTSTTNWSLTLSGTNKWNGGVLGADNKIYCAPSAATNVLVIDTLKLSAVRTNFGLNLADTFMFGKWNNAVPAPNGKVYCIPRGVPDFLIIDTLASTVSATRSAMGITSISDAKYSCGSLAPNGRIYVFPDREENMIVVDPFTNTAAFSACNGAFAFAAGGTTDAKFAGTVVDYEGKIWGVSHDWNKLMRLTTAPDPIYNYPIERCVSAHYNK